MEELELLDKELNEKKARTQELCGEEEAKKVFEKYNIPEDEEIETSREIDERC